MSLSFLHDAEPSLEAAFEPMSELTSASTTGLSGTCAMASRRDRHSRIHLKYAQLPTNGGSFARRSYLPLSIRNQVRLSPLIFLS